MKNLLIIFLAGVFAFGISCSSDNSPNNKSHHDKEEKNDNEKDSEDKPTNPFDALKKAAKDLDINVETDGEEIETVNFRDLKKILPDDFSGYDRTEATGSTQGMFGIKISQAEAKYENEDQGRIEIKINDVAGFKMAIAGLAAWANIEMEKETDDGYERTFEYKGNKAFEKYNSKTRRGEKAVLVNDRYVLTISGRNVDEQELNKALTEIDLDDLIELEE